LRTNRTIERIDFTGNPLGASSLIHISEFLLVTKNLKYLNFERCKIRNEGCKNLIEGLKNNKTLTELNLRENEISDEGFGHLLEGLKENKTLKTLNISSLFLKLI
jgi:NLR family CARD domain-containing protein 3